MQVLFKYDKIINKERDFYCCKKMKMLFLENSIKKEKNLYSHLLSFEDKECGHHSFYINTNSVQIDGKNLSNIFQKLKRSLQLKAYKLKKKTRG